MRIAIVSDYVSQGGAAIACNRLADALGAVGVFVRRFALQRCNRPNSSSKQVTFAQEPFGRRIGALIDVVSAFNLRRTAQSLRVLEVEKHLLKAISDWKPDVINVHNLHAFSSELLILPKVAKIAPLVWTLHDMWSFTGRCAYNDDCRQFEKGCSSSCPTANEYPVLAPQLIRAQWQSRSEFLGIRPNIVAVTPSAWLASEARRGLWRHHRVEVIPNSLNLQLYRPVDRGLARKALGVHSSNRPHILIAAESNSERRKGGHLLAAVLAECHRDVTLLTIGNNVPRNLPKNVEVLHLGYLADERTKCLAYSAADIFLHPAPMDNLPNTVVEAIACGTPVVAFRTGGLAEMVKPEITGWLAERLTSNSLGAVLRMAIDSLSEMPIERSTVRAFAERSYAPSLQALAYRRLFSRMNEYSSERFACA